MKKRLFSLIMVLILSFVSVNEVRADAGSLIIAGGSVATIGAGVISGPAVVAVFCAMMAFGMNVELTKATEEAGMTKTEFLKNKIEQYCIEAKISANTFNNYVLDQANVYKDGAISLTDKAGKVIEQFCNWLFETDSVSQGSQSVIVVDGKNYPVLQPGQSGVVGSYVYSADNGTREMLYAYNSGNYPIALGYLNDGSDSRFFCFSLEAFTDIKLNFTLKKVSDGKVEVDRDITSYTSSRNNVYYVFLQSLVNQWINVSSINTTIPRFDGSINDFCDSVETSIISGNTDTITGDQSIYDTSKGVLNPADEHTIILNPNITIPVPTDKDVTIDVNTYIETIQDLIDGLRDDVIEAIDTATGTPITIEFDPTQDWDPTIEDKDDTELPPIEDKTPIVKDDIIPHDFDPDPMKFDLKGIFPFCIPWDIKDMLSKLSADPVAPSYTVNWMIPIVNERLNFTVDLSPFNGVAQICRNMELLAFCIGLAVVTRQLFLRG